MAHKDSREVLDGIQPQGIGESVSYSVDTAPWGGTPISLSHDVFDEEDYTTSLKATLMPGTPTVSVDNVVLPALSGLAEDVTYRVFITFDSGGNTLQGYFRVRGER